eukprot:9340571-Prorocentrum_lima.AAC.1
MKQLTQCTNMNGHRRLRACLWIVSGSTLETTIIATNQMNRHTKFAMVKSFAKLIGNKIGFQALFHKRAIGDT